MLGVGKEKQNCACLGEEESVSPVFWPYFFPSLYGLFLLSHASRDPLLYSGTVSGSGGGRFQQPYLESASIRAPGLHHGLPSWNLQSCHKPDEGGLADCSLVALWAQVPHSTWKNAPLWSHIVTVTPANYCARSFLNTLCTACFYYSEKGSEKRLGTLPSLNSSFSRHFEPLYRHPFFVCLPFQICISSELPKEIHLSTFFFHHPTMS